MEADGLNIEKYVKELAKVSIDIARASGRMFEQEHLRLINMVAAMNTRGSGGTGSLTLIEGSWSTVWFKYQT